MLKLFLKGKNSNKKKHIKLWRNSFVRLVDIILDKMSDAPEDPSGAGQGTNAYANQPGGYNKSTTKLTANDSQPKGNQCQC